MWRPLAVFAIPFVSCPGKMERTRELVPFIVPRNCLNFWRVVAEPVNPPTFLNTQSDFFKVMRFLMTFVFYNQEGH